jgi:hypothetical protein
MRVVIEEVVTVAQQAISRYGTSSCLETGQVPLQGLLAWAIPRL